MMAAISSGLIIRFCFGVYEHHEFSNRSLFIKHRPTWKWYFYSPIGISDKSLEDLTEEQKREQLYFNEFVRNRGLK